MRLVDPVDQATGLRRLFAATPAFRAVGVLGPDPRRNARVSAELALGLGRRGKQVLVLDEGRPPYNVGGMWGLLARRSLADVPGVPLAEATIDAAPGVRLLAAHEGMRHLARMDEQSLLAMADHWGDAPEWMLVNGKGDGPASAGLATTTELRILVLPGDKAWLAEAYGILKSAHAAWSGGTWMVLVEGAALEPAERLYTSLQDTALRFLGFAPAYLGCLPRAKEGADASDGLHGGLLAETLQGVQMEQQLSFDQFWQRLWLFSRMSTDASSMNPGVRDGVRRGMYGSRYPG